MDNYASQVVNVKRFVDRGYVAGEDLVELLLFFFLSFFLLKYTTIELLAKKDRARLYKQ